MRRIYNKLFIIILLCLSLAGCTTPGISVDTTPQTTKILNEAITTLNTLPNEWQNVLTDTVAKLKDVSSAVTSDVQNLLSESTALVTTQVQCNVDIIGVRISDSLRFIRDSKVNNLTNAKLPTPWVCVFTPNRLILTRTSTNSPWTLSSPQIVDVYGVNFRFLNLPKVDQLNSNSDVIRQDVLKPRLQSPYLIQMDFQAVDFSHFNTGDHFALKWKESSEQYTLSLEFQAPPVPITSFEDFQVNVHANSGLFNGDCKNIQDDSAATHKISSGWQIDRTKGDQSHVGVSEIAVNDNMQSKNSLRGYNYQIVNDYSVQVEGTICGASAKGPGAIFSRTYRVYLIKI